MAKKTTVVIFYADKEKGQEPKRLINDLFLRFLRRVLTRNEGDAGIY